MLANMATTSENMATVLAHEIKNPAALALAYVSLLRQSTDFKEIENYCNHIQHAILDISDLVQELLFTTQNLPEKHVVNASEILKEIIEEYRVAKPGISFLLNHSNILCNTYEQHLRLIFSNLLKNAVEAVGFEGDIVVDIKELQDHVHFSFQNKKTNITKPYGSGMGINICNWLVSKIGGKLEIENLSKFTANLFIPTDIL